MVYYKILKNYFSLLVCIVYQMQTTTIRFSIKMLFCFGVFLEGGYYYLPKHAAKLIMYMSTNKRYN
jgi:hypothetical protein